jgi:hypothetical protein
MTEVCAYLRSKSLTIDEDNPGQVFTKHIKHACLILGISQCTATAADGSIVDDDLIAKINHLHWLPGLSTSFGYERSSNTS